MREQAAHTIKAARDKREAQNVRHLYSTYIAYNIWYVYIVYGINIKWYMVYFD